MDNFPIIIIILLDCNSTLLPKFGGRPNLFAAIEGGHTKVAKLLIENGADVNEINKVCIAGPVH